MLCWLLLRRLVIDFFPYPSVLAFHLMQVIALSLWLIYFYVPERVRHVFVAHDGPGSVKSQLGIGSSNDYGFLIFAEGAAERVGDFAHGGVGFHGGEDGGEKIFGGGGGRGGVGRGGWGAGGVALGAQGVEAD